MVMPSSSTSRSISSLRLVLRIPDDPDFGALRLDAVDLGLRYQP
jgi:hypothetical protein